MAILTDRYAVPSGIHWQTSGGYGQQPLTVPTGGVTAYLAFYSPYNSFQLQYRTRRRLKPSAALLTEPSGADVWTDWGAWAGTDVDADASFVPRRDGGRRIAEAYPVALAHDLGDATADMIEVQARVRVINEPDLSVSAWAYGTVQAVPLASLTFTGSEWTDAGTMRAEWSTDYERGLLTGVAGPWWDGPSRLRAVSYARLTTQPDGSGFSLDIPASYTLSGAGWSTIQCVTVDGAPIDQTTASTWSAQGRMHRIAEAGMPDDPGVAAPDVVFDDGAVAVASTGDPYDSVTVAATWADAYGRAGQHLAAATDDVGGGVVWTAQLPPLPFDVPVQLNVAVTAGGASRTVSQTVEVESGGAAELSGDGGTLRIPYNVEYSIEGEPVAEPVEVAGRSLPVARLGASTRARYDVEGVAVRDDWPLSGFAAAALPGVWTLRLPRGIVARVIVTSVQVGTDDAPALIDVRLTCEEVA